MVFHRISKHALSLFGFEGSKVHFEFKALFIRCSCWITELLLLQEVFDKDLLKADDKMGNAFVNLQPLVSAARLRDILRVSSGETTLRKVVPDSENCLVRESSINCVNGEVVQNVWLRLRDVESGEVELTIKLITPVAPSK